MCDIDAVKEISSASLWADGSTVEDVNHSVGEESERLGVIHPITCRQSLVTPGMRPLKCSDVTGRRRGQGGTGINSHTSKHPVSPPAASLRWRSKFSGMPDR